VPPACGSQTNQEVIHVLNRPYICDGQGPVLISAGIEDVDDPTADLDQALANV
jgi:O-acetylhomoserine/O-acetylserine sulfhydrylase-like pyridoxal-dependent enzyme